VAARHGRFASLSIAATVIQGYLDNAALNVTADTADTTAFGDTWKEAIVGLLGGTISGSGQYDPTTSTGPQAVLWTAFTGGAPVAVVYYPGGNVSNQRSYSFSAILTNMVETSVVSDKVTFTFDMLITGAVTPATI
jgi:hypothetical protein